ncbi:MAG TPA: hypothetical protein VG474_13835 [Solirubrobacteraceae bacterium]|nr:hypothetical protein [Solirubrobacteraceae bacterium]
MSSTNPSEADVAALRDAADAAQFELALAYEEIAQKVAAGDDFTTAQQNAAAQLLEISAAVRELAAQASDVARGGARATLAPRAQQLVARAAELRAAFGRQAVSQADRADRPGRPPRY